MEIRRSRFLTRIRRVTTEEQARSVIEGAARSTSMPGTTVPPSSSAPTGEPPAARTTANRRAPQVFPC
ncbi:hypothetical protein [Tessaracoccus coleopterorum]|uniref:hypothetical protein n=1 Tax=Tessaracoccus coleopterorum TaxID=2714950 RepID=UPI001E557FB0|nr:hypothetical protein [Tessaracoccus coleopterorum]